MNASADQPADYLMREAYLHLRDPEFTILPAASEPISSRLVEVSELKQRGSMESFSILLLTEPLDHAEQGSYAVRNRILGEMELFLVPIGRHASGGIELEAVFTT
jgi:hypothetical protein